MARLKTDELLNNGWGRGQGVTVRRTFQTIPAGTYRIRIQYYEISGGNEFHLVSSSWVPRQFVASAGNPRQIVRAIVLNFEPRIPSEGNRKLWEVFGWTDPRVLARQFEADLEFMTGGAIDVQIVDWRDLNEFPMFSDGFRYSPDAYVANRRSNTGWHDGVTDFYHLARQQNLAALVNSNLVDEIWCFGDHFFSLFGEAWMAGPNSFFINGPSFPDAGFDRAIAGYGFNYERGVAEMVHNLSHRTENHGQRAFGGWNLANPVTAFDRFSANYLDSPGRTAGVGTCHVPANADGHYDYADPRIVASSAWDWPNYPNLTATTTSVSSASWAFGPASDYHRDYMDFYFGMMPRNAGTAPDGRQANWFKYIWDFNSYESGTGLPRNEDAFGAGPTILSPGGTNEDFTVRYYDQTGINVATLDHSDIEVRGPGGFVQVATLVRIGPEIPTTAGSALTVTYRVTAPGGTWDRADAGSYRIYVRSSQVSDTAGNFVPAGEIGRFQVSLSDPSVIRVSELLSTGQATVAHTTLDIGPIANLFDGSVDTLVRTPNIDPAIVTLSFSQLQTIHGFQAYFSYASGDPAIRWQVETADTQADLDSRTGSWRQAVPITGTTVERYSSVALTTPILARMARLTATKLNGDNYVHMNEWQSMGPPVVDSSPPSASGTSTNVSRPGATGQFITVTYTDATGISINSLNTGNLLVTGPNGFQTNAAFYGVDSYFDGTPRTATYWFIPPEGAWDSTDNGAYSFTLQPGQVRDTLGNSQLVAQTLGTFVVNVPPPVLRPACDLTETNATEWLAGAEGATARTSNDGARKLLGVSSVRFDTDGGFDTWLRFPPPDAADWNLTASSNLYFSVFAENTNSFQGSNPWIRLRDDNGGYFEFHYYQNGNVADLLTGARGVWRSFIVPLRAPDNVVNGWRRITVENPRLNHIASIEFHADTWGSGFSLWYDRVGFDLPVKVIESGMELVGGSSLFRLRFDESVESSLTTADLLIQNRATGALVPTAALSLSYQASSNTALISFPGLPAGLLPSGRYRLVLAADAVADPAGNRMAGSFTNDFAVVDGDADSDEDGMPNTWEDTYSLNPLNAFDAAADADDDGQSNLREYWAGTSPRDPASCLALTRILPGADTVQLTWRSVHARRYHIHWSDNLATWTVFAQNSTPVVIDASPTGSLTSYTLSNGAPPAPTTRFYRVEVLAR